MKFQATVVFEFQAGSIVDAGHKLSDTVEQASAREMEAKVVELRTPPESAAPVTLPSVTVGPRPDTPRGAAAAAS